LNGEKIGEGGLVLKIKDLEEPRAAIPNARNDFCFENFWSASSGKRKVIEFE